jgi:GntR family transcriptional regulator
MYNFRVDKSSSRPIYLQIRDRLLEAIEQGLFQPGQKIPSARDLSVQMDVSRMTVLQALRDLTHQGRVYSVTGKGTFVSLPEKLEPNLRTVWGFTETFQAQGYTLSSQLVMFDHMPADAKAAAALQVPEGTPLNRIKRKRLLNGHPVGIETAHLVLADFPELCDYDWNQASLYAVLRGRYGIELVGGRNYIEAAAAPDDIARHLSIPKHTPVLSTQRITYASNMRPVELVFAFYRGDRMRMMVDMIHENPVNILSSKLDHLETATGT